MAAFGAIAIMRQNAAMKRGKGVFFIKGTSKRSLEKYMNISRKSKDFLRVNLELASGSISDFCLTTC